MMLERRADDDDEDEEEYRTAANQTQIFRERNFFKQKNY